MASTKPNRTARWATDGGATLEPSSGEKDVGWVVEDKPPARHMNFLQNIAFQWFRWFDERHKDGGTNDDYETHAPDPASGAAGDGTFRAGDSVDSTGGAGVFRGGDSAAGDGGNATYRGGDSVGTNRNAGDATLSGGEGTGSGRSSAKIQASTMGTPGTTPNPPEDYIVADGFTGLVQLFKGLINTAALTKRALDLITNGITTARMVRESADTAGSRIILDLIHKTSAESVDGLGAQLQLGMEDATSGFQPQVQIQGERDGADNSGELVIRPRLAGSFSNALRLRATGLAEFLRGLRGDGLASNINGAGLLGRGLVSSGSLGTAETEVGVGAHGVGSEVGGGVTGYGMIAQGSDTGTPTRSSLRVVPQTNEPSAGQKGDLWTDDAGNLAISDGTNFERLFANAFAQTVTSQTVTNTTTETAFDKFHIVPAGTLNIGSVLRISASVSVQAVTGSPNLTLRVKFGDDAAPGSATSFGSEIFSSITVAGVLLITGTVVIKSSTDARQHTGFQFDGTPNQFRGSAGDTGATPFNLAIANDLFITATWSAAAAGNQVNLFSFTVDIS